MKRFLAVALIYILFASQLAWAGCPDGSVGPVCNNISGAAQINQINNAFNGATVINPDLGPSTVVSDVNINGIFNVDTYGASHQTATFSVDTTASSPTITCAVAGCGGLKVGNGIMIAQAGPTAAYPASAGTPTATHVGSGTGTHTYKWLIVVADPFGGMAAAGTPTTTATSIPAIGSLGTADYFTFSNTASAGAVVPVYLLYRSYDSGSYTFVTADTNSNIPGTPDIGQTPAGARGWPATLSGGTGFAGRRQNLFTYVTTVIDSTHIVVNNAPSTTITGATAQGDDSRAIYLAEQAAETAGGGTVQFGPYSYNVSRPMFYTGTAWTDSLARANASYFPAHIPVDSSNMTFAGTNQQQTILISRPDEYITGLLFGFGTNKPRPWDRTYYAMSTVDRGDLYISLTTPSDSVHFAVGDDVWMFTGSFSGKACPASRGTPGANCHWAETNSIIAIDSTAGKLYLKYPANKKYYNDSISPFGVVDEPQGTVSLHNLSIHDLTGDIYDPLNMDGVVINEQVYNVSLPSGVNGGIRYGGMGRNLSYNNINAVIGDGGALYHVEEELDLDADVSITNSRLSLLSGTAGTYLSPGISLTEGTSGVIIKGNQLTGIMVESDNGSDSIVVSGNNLYNGGILLGMNNFGAAFVASFGTPTNWVISNNNVIGLANSGGNGAQAAISTYGTVAQGVSITDNSVRLLPTDATTYCYAAASGLVTGNSCYTNHASSGQGGFIVKGQVASGVPLLPIVLAGNQNFAANSGIGIRIEDPGAVWNGNILLDSNISILTHGTGDNVVNSTNTPNVRAMNEYVTTPDTPYNPSSLSNHHSPNLKVGGTGRCRKRPDHH